MASRMRAKLSFFWVWVEVVHIFRDQVPNHFFVGNDLQGRAFLLQEKDMCCVGGISNFLDTFGTIL